MANPFVLDFSPVQNALSQWQKQRQFDQAQQFQSRQFDEGVRQFGVQNALARDRFGLEQAQAGRQDQLFPLQMDQMQAQIEATRRAGATEAQMTPLRIQQLRAQTELAQAQAAQARQKDELNASIARMIGGAMPGQPQQPMPEPGPIRPQSFEGGGDPMLIPTQDSGMPRPPSAPIVQPNMVNTPLGPMTMDRARQMGFALGMAGKGDAGKMLIDAADASKLGKEARNKVDEQELNAVNAMGRLKQIADGYNDKFLTIEGKLKNYGLSWLDSFDTLRKRMKPEDVAELQSFTAFQRDAVENLTEGIRAATGAAMGIQEEDRIRKGLPDPQKDSPTQFKSKLVGSYKSLQLAVQRTQFLRQNGFQGDANSAAARMPIERFEQLQRDSRTLYQRMKQANPEADDGAIRDQVKQQMLRKYRVDA